MQGGTSPPPPPKGGPAEIDAKMMLFVISTKEKSVFRVVMMLRSTIP
jgi:hypothetical protein